MEQQHGGDVYRNRNVTDFSSNINPLGTPVSVMESAAESLGRLADYPDTQCDKLREALAAYERVEPEQLIFGNGAAELIFTLAQALRPKKALLMAPTFLEYEQALRSVDCGIAYCYLKKERGFQVSEDLPAHLTPELDILFLCNPNNPTGQVIPKDLLLRILEKCRECKIFLVVDECFLDFLDEEERFTLKPYLAQYENLFLLKAFTKRYGMAGLRLGYGITGNRGLLKKMRESVQPWNVSIPAQAAGIAALKEEDHVRKGLDIIRAERPFLTEELEKLGYTVYGSRANYIFFEADENLYEQALQGGFLIRDCSNYPGLRKGYYRIAVKTHEENVRLIRWLNQL